ncbi:M23 family metallopeptidase [Sphingomonas bacterium]|uniref:M23 family metallopeptidase n=1 Tax=Sphingomonas bacterium TaxID=1895847 RepID=UPI0020C652A5|nr:M23 family metallopeptidase [Sphingomonas bacterium]
MTRIGWVFLGLVALATAAFVAMTSFGGPAPIASATPTAATTRPFARLRSAVQRIEHRLRSSAATGEGPVLGVPVQGVARAAITDTWGQARSEGRVHHGTDIPAPQGTPVLAVADGTIEKLFASRLGGTTLYERSVDRRWTFYYAHLSGYAPGLHEGQVVHAGEQVGMVGDTGDAGPGNYHLHFGLTRTTPDQHWYQGEDVNAYPYLAAGAPGR